MNKGLHISPGASATVYAVPCANLLLRPTTNVENVYLGLRLDS